MSDRTMVHSGTLISGTPGPRNCNACRISTQDDMGKGRKESTEKVQLQSRAVTGPCCLYSRMKSHGYYRADPDRSLVSLGCVVAIAGLCNSATMAARDPKPKNEFRTRRHG